MRISPNEIKYEVIVRHDDAKIIEWFKGRDLYRAFSHVVTQAILEEQTNPVLACSRPSEGGTRVERGGSGKGGRPDPRFRSLASFSLAAVLVRYHRLRAWNRLTLYFS